MRWLENHWYRDSLVSRLLLPLAWIYEAMVAVRRSMYRAGIKRQVRVGAPVIVVGNISVGGTGKTPLAIWLARFLSRSGYRPGIVTRGYRGHATAWPVAVQRDSDPDQVGDEPVVLARHAGCPVVADPDRVRGAAYLRARHDCDLIISDDGLQHLRLARDMEIVVIDGERRFGNNRCLPAGPLREPAARALRADARVIHGDAEPGAWGMKLVASAFYRLGQPDAAEPAARFGAASVHAVAGIGYPERFFAQLRRLGLKVIAHPFPDHHRFHPQDLRFPDQHPVIMTEKDAVKCERFSTSAWYLAVEAEPDPGFGAWVVQRLRGSAHG